MLSSLFARRYLFSRKSHSVINIISVVSAAAVAVPVAAMVILLSVFNGFEGLVREMYGDFDPDVLVAPARGKTFAEAGLAARMEAIEGVEAWSFVVEDNAMVDYRGGQGIVTLRGVDSLYNKVVPIERRMAHGDYALHFGQIEQAVVGQGVAHTLGVNIRMYDYLNLYAPRRDGVSALLPLESYRSEQLLPAGVFALDAQTDSRYLIAPIETARRLFDYPGRATALAVKLLPGASVKPIKEALGDDFRVLTRWEQKASLYRIMRYEKWGIFLIIGLVLVIASFSVVGSIVMLVIDKREEIRTLTTMGGTLRFLRAIFTRQGMLIALGGALAGMVAGVGICLLQQHFGWVRLPSETFVVEAYPVVLQGGDLLLIAALIVAAGFLIVRLTAVKMIPKQTLRLLGLALCVVLATGCSRSHEIPDATLSAMLEEIYIADAFVQERMLSKRDSVDIYTPIFEKYGYTPRDFAYTLESFSRRKSSRVGDVMGEAIERIEERYAFYNARLAAIDTIESRALERHKRLVYSDSLIVATRIADTSKLRIRLPAVPGRYRIDYTYLIDTADFNSSLFTSHILYDSLGKEAVNRPNWMARMRPTPYSIDLDAPAGSRRLELVFGNYGSSDRRIALTEPDMRIEGLTIHHYPSTEQAVDSLTAQLFPLGRPELFLPVWVAAGDSLQ